MKRKILIDSCVALLLLCGSAIAAIAGLPAGEKVAGILRHEPLCSGEYGVLAVKMNGDTLVCLNPDNKLLPASTTKVITTALALMDLGPDYRFETSIGYTGRIEGAVLKGDLYIVGGGDPTTAARYDRVDSRDALFSKWIDFVRKAGIRSIEGRVIGDPRALMSTMPENPGWLCEDVGSSYGAAPVGLNFFENRQTFQVCPGPAVGTMVNVSPRYPDTPWMQYANTAVTTAQGSRNELCYESTPFMPYGAVRGTFPIDWKAYTLEAVNRFGAYTCAFGFCRYLKGEGITVSGGCADVSPTGLIRSDLSLPDGGSKAAPVHDIKMLGTTFSPCLTEVVSMTNHKSDNFFAETLLKTMSVRHCGSAEYDRCREVVGTLLSNMGLRTESSCRYYDGSGLSRKNYISPAFFVSFLRKIAMSDLAGVFKVSLPHPGEEDTTLQFRMKSAPQDLKTRIWMKSGSMDGVACLCGYVDASDGNPDNMIVFSIMTNNSPGHIRTVYSMIDDIVGAIAAEN